MNGFNTRNHSISTTKGTAQGLIQRYKACYSQKGVTHIHSGRKRLVVRRYGWIQNIANPLLAPAPLPDMFCNKNNAISPEAIGGGDNHSSHPKKASDTASTSSPQKQPGWLRCEEQRRRPERKQVFVLLANTLLAPTRTNRVLSSEGRVLSSEEPHIWKS